ncbi:TIGR02444 family protein [Algibacillus agarilyticus]|uniref:TIGR02444 family protein n=1 Tax=Algibacillus agarilyticus TaxID=2234133 RepID=UPI001300AC59|nr:TIGR02444 family protein [Algibacillus agarilyticus]
MIDRQQFWNFACDLYAQPHVSSELLALQNSLGANINLVLLLAYLSHHNMMIDAKFIQQLHQQIDSFSQTNTQIIRATRKQLQGSETLTQTEQAEIKKQLLTVELTAEKIEQDRLLSWLATLSIENPKLNSLKQSPCLVLIEQYIQQLTTLEKEASLPHSIKNFTLALSSI